jgi:Regulator of chromosome condensation (RCC1) repeat
MSSATTASTPHNTTSTDPNTATAGSTVAPPVASACAPGYRDTKSLDGIFYSMNRISGRTNFSEPLELHIFPDEQPPSGHKFTVSSGDTPPAAAAAPASKSLESAKGDEAKQKQKQKTSTVRSVRTVDHAKSLSSKVSSKGSSSSAKRRAYFVRVPELESEEIRWIAVGDYHSAALTEDGRVYTWGRNPEWAPLGNGQVWF